MNQRCKVCDEPAAGFHFGAFTCEGCKSFFGRAHTNPAAAVSAACKTGGGRCVIDKKNRTSCKACRLKKCLAAGMSKSGSRYGRRSNWFKVHCLLQERRLLPLPGDDDDDDDDDCRRGGDKSFADVAPPPIRIALLSLPIPLQRAPPPFRFFGFAPRGRAPLPRSERSAFRDTAAIGSSGDEDDDRPVDLTVRQSADDVNNNETAACKSSAARQLQQLDATPLDLCKKTRQVTT